jgi:hypothetical protein
VLYFILFSVILPIIIIIIKLTTSTVLNNVR